MPKLTETLIDVANELRLATDVELFEALTALEEGYHQQLRRLATVPDMGRWMCPNCGVTTLAGSAPDCIDGCDDYMVAISTKLYAELTSARAKRGTNA